jgi:transposase
MPAEQPAADTPPPARCSRCGHRPVRAERQRFCRECHNAAARDRNARLAKALQVCKRAGLTIVATDGGFVSVPLERVDETRRS